MVIVDHNKNIQRIIDRILADSNLFDSGATVGLLRSVEFGDPANKINQATKEMPYAYVTTASDLQETTPEIGVSVPDNVKSVTVEYQIVVVAQARDRQVNSQKLLYDLITPHLYGFLLYSYRSPLYLIFTSIFIKSLPIKSLRTDTQSLSRYSFLTHLLS